MTPELWNLGGSIMLTLVGIIMIYLGWLIDVITDGDGSPVVVLGLVTSFFGMILIIANWGPFGAAMFGGGR